MLVLHDMWSRFGIEMFVISASVDPEDTAEGFDAVLEMELMYGV